MLKKNWTITIKYFIWLSLVILLFSCNTKQQSSNHFEQQIKYANDSYGDTLFNHFPEEMSLNPKKNKSIANAIYRLKSNSIASDSNNFKPLFLLYGEKYRNERKFNSHIERLKKKNSILVEVNQSTCFYIFDFEAKNNQIFVYPFFGEIKDNQTLPLNHAAASIYLDFNTNKTSQKLHPLPLLNDTITIINNHEKYILSEDLRHYIIKQTNSGVLQEKINNSNCLPTNWEHGFSQGYSVSTKDRYILYWILIW